MPSLYFETEWAQAVKKLGGAPPPPDPTDPGESIVINSPSLRAASDVFDPATLGNADLLSWYNIAKTGYIYNEDQRPADQKLANDIKWDIKYADMYRVEQHLQPNGITRQYRLYTGPFCGQYMICRGLANKAFAFTNAGFRATKDLYILSVAAIEVMHAVSLAEDLGGVGSTTPDGFLGWSYGTDGQKRIFFAPNDVRNTAVVRDGYVRYADEDGGNEGRQNMTGTELVIEDAVAPPYMVTALGCWQNRDRYCPIHEPVGSRPPTPQYYRNVALAAVALYEDMAAKYDAFYMGQGGNKKTLPLHIRRSLLHAALGEIVGAICYAKIKGGADWKQHAEYLSAVRAWNMILGPSQRAGAGVVSSAKAQWYQFTHATYGVCNVFGHHVQRYYPSNTKDSTGEYTTTRTSQGVHNLTYTINTFGAISFFYMEGCTEFEGLDRTFMERCANTVAAVYRVSGDMPEYMNGGILTSPSGWGSGSGLGTSKSTGYGLFSFSPFGVLAPWDTHNLVPGFNAQAYANANGRVKIGAITVQMLNFAVREGFVPA